MFDFVKKTRPSQASQSIFLIVVVCLAMAFLPNVSAFEFDNVKSYNEELKVVTITNAYGIGSVIGQAKLTSPLNVRVGAGYQKVAQFDIWAYDDYNDAIKQFTFIDMKKKERINRNFDIKKLTYNTVEVEDYYWDCPKGLGEDYDAEKDCVRVITGTHEEILEVWTKVTPADLKKNNIITIGIFTDVQVGDHVDWIPTIYGVEVEEWAEWTQDLNVGLKVYYNENEQDTSGSGNIIDSLNVNNATNDGASNSSGKLGTAYDFDGTNDYLYSASNIGITGSQDRTISFWFKTSETARVDMGAVSLGVGATHAQFGITFVSNTDTVKIATSSGNKIWNLPGSWNDDTWKHFILTLEGTTTGDMEAYMNNVTLTQNGVSDTLVETGASIVTVGKLNYVAASWFVGNIDEVSIWNRSISQEERNQLWNDGDGITFGEGSVTPPPQVTLTSPDNYENLTSSAQDFIATVTDNSYVENVSLKIDGTIVNTSTSHVNGSYTFSQTITEGYHNWSILAYDDEGESNQSETRFYNYTLPPIPPPQVTLTSPDNYENLTSSAQDFIATVTDNSYVENVSLKIDGTIVNTSTSHVNGSYTFSQTITEGYHNWSILAYDDEGESNQSETRFYNYTEPGPVVTLNSPANSANLITPSIDFNCTAFDNVEIVNVSLMVDGVIDQTNTSGINNSNYIFTKTGFTDGDYNWSCKAYDNSGYSTSPTARDFNVTIPSVPIVTLNSPADEAVSSTLTTFNCSATVGGGTAINNITLWNNISSSWIANKTIVGFVDEKDSTETQVSSTSPTLVLDIINVDKHIPSISWWADGRSSPNNNAYSYAKFYYTNGSTHQTTTIMTVHGLPYTLIEENNPFPYKLVDKIEVYGYSAVAGSPYTFYKNLTIFTFNDLVFNNTITDTTLWNCFACADNGECNFSASNRTVNLDTTAPVISVTNPTGVYQYNKAGDTKNLNWTITEDSPDTCWYSYNSTNTTVTCNDNTTSLTLVSGDNDLIFYANDTSGNIGSDTATWGYRVWENSRTYDSSILIGSNATFIINIDANATLENVTFIYNNTLYDVTGGPSYSKTLTLVDAGSIDFYWNFTYAGDVFSSDTSTQSVLEVGIDDCSLFTNVIYNFTMFDERTQTKLTNTSSSLELKLYDSSGTTEIFNYATSYTTNPFAVCLEDAVGNSTFYIDGVVEYSSPTRFTEFYNINDYALTQSTSNQNISLYNLLESEGQEFKITYKGQDFIPVTDLIIQIQRKYIEEGVYKVVEIPMSGSNGYTVGHLVPNDIIYNLIFIKNGVILNTFSEVIANCQNPTITECEINLNALISGTDLLDLVTDDEFFSSLSYDKDTRTITSTYGILSGVSDNVQLNVTLNDNFGTTTVCSDSLNAAGGTLSCTVPESFGNSTIYAAVTYDGVIKREGFISMAMSPKEKFGGVLIFASMIMLLFIFGIGISDNPAITGVFLILGSLLLVGLNLVYSTSILGAGATILWFVAAVLVVIIKGGGKR